MGKIKFTNLKLLDIFQPNISKKKIYGVVWMLFFITCFFFVLENKKNSDNTFDKIAGDFFCSPCCENACF